MNRLPLRQVDPSGATDGQVPTYNAASKLWVPATPASGGGGGAVLPLDQPPASPSTLDDDFSGATLDPKWSVADSAAVCVPSTTLSGGWLILQPTSADSGHRGGVGIRQPAPVAGFTVTAKVVDNMQTADNARVGVYVGRSAASTATMLGIHTASSWWAEAVGISGYSLVNEWGAYDGFQVTKTGLSPWVWQKIVWDPSAGTLTFYGSVNGVVWGKIGTRTGVAQPTEVGLVLWSHEAASVAVDHQLVVDWFRVA